MRVRVFEFIRKSILRSYPSHKISSMKLCVVLINIYWSRKGINLISDSQVKCNLTMHFNFKEFSIKSKFEVILFCFCENKLFFRAKKILCSQCELHTILIELNEKCILFPINLFLLQSIDGELKIFSFFIKKLSPIKNALTLHGKPIWTLFIYFWLIKVRQKECFFHSLF